MSEQPPEQPPEQPLTPETPAEPPEEPSAPPATPRPKPHPFRLVNEDDLKRSRLTVLVRILLVIPHAIWLTLYALVAILVTIANWFATLITGRPPERIHHWLTRFLRYWAYVTAYL